MITTAEIVKELESMGSPGIKKVLTSHGAREPFYGVKVEYLKKIQKRIKKDYELSLRLFETGISDAMYLAGLISDPSKMTKDDLNSWVQNAYWSMISEYAVAWTAAESHYGLELALEWIESKDEQIAVAGWSTLSNILMFRKDDELDISLLNALLERVRKTIHSQPNRVRYVMNGFVIALGGGVIGFKEKAVEAAKSIGKVSVDMGGTACKVPDIAAYIQKMEDRGVIGKKKKTVKC